MKKGTFLQSFYAAWQGVVYVVKTQRNMRIHLVVALLVIFGGYFFEVSINEWLVLILIIAVVLIAESINTAVEATMDLLTEEYHPLAKIAKDTAAGAVLLAALSSVVIGIIIFYGKVYNLFQNWF